MIIIAAERIASHWNKAIGLWTHYSYWPSPHPPVLVVSCDVYVILINRQVSSLVIDIIRLLTE